MVGYYQFYVLSVYCCYMYMYEKIIIDLKGEDMYNKDNYVF